VYWICIYFNYFSEEINTHLGNSNNIKFVLKIYLLGRFISQGKIRQNIRNYEYTLKTINLKIRIFFFWRSDLTWALASTFMRFLDHTQRRTTVGRTPLEEWSARRRDFSLTTHNIHIRHAPGEIRTHNLSRRAATDQPLRPLGHWDRMFSNVTRLIFHRILRDESNRCFYHVYTP
jgi:hypothetical protein